MKRVLIHLGIFVLIFVVFGTIVGWLFIIASLLLRYTQRGQQVLFRIKRGFLIWRYEILNPWFKRHKDSWFFKSIENARWFPWYGKRIMYVKSKDSSKLSDPQKAIRDAIQAKDYVKALEIVNSVPESPQTITLRQVIEAKLK